MRADPSFDLRGMLLAQMTESERLEVYLLRTWFKNVVEVAQEAGEGHLVLEWWRKGFVDSVMRVETRFTGSLLRSGFLHRGLNSPN